MLSFWNWNWNVFLSISRCCFFKFVLGSKPLAVHLLQYHSLIPWRSQQVELTSLAWATISIFCGIYFYIKDCWNVGFKCCTDNQILNKAHHNLPIDSKTDNLKITLSFSIRLRTYAVLHLFKQCRQLRGNRKLHCGLHITGDQSFNH